MSKATIAVTALILVAAPLTTLTATAVTDDAATWGLCQAYDANRQGNDSSDGTVDETPPFSNLSEEDCDEAEDPWNSSDGDASDNGSHDGERP